MTSVPIRVKLTTSVTLDKLRSKLVGKVQDKVEKITRLRTDPGDTVADLNAVIRRVRERDILKLIGNANLSGAQMAGASPWTVSQKISFIGNKAFSQKVKYPAGTNMAIMAHKQMGSQIVDAIGTFDSQAAWDRVIARRERKAGRKGKDDDEDKHDDEIIADKDGRLFSSRGDGNITLPWTTIVPYRYELPEDAKDDVDDKITDNGMAAMGQLATGIAIGLGVVFITQQFT